MRKIPGSDIEVTKEDQANINTFSKLYSKNQDNQGQLASLKEKINQSKKYTEKQVEEKKEQPQEKTL